MTHNHTFLLQAVTGSSEYRCIKNSHSKETQNFDADVYASKAWRFFCDHNKEEILLQHCSKWYREAADIMISELGPQWNGRTHSQLRKSGFLGLTDLYIEKANQINVSVLRALITLDCNYEELCKPSLISSCWKKLHKSENTDILSFLFDNCSDPSYIKATELMSSELGDKWRGWTFHEVRGGNWSGFAHYLLKKSGIVELRRSAVLDLIQIDKQYGVSLDETISASWKCLVNNEGLLLSLLEQSDSTYARAMEFFYRKFGKKWDGENFEKNRTYKNIYGYTSVYLWWSVNKEDYSSSANLTDMEKLARLDLKEGATIPELILTCCEIFPRKTAIEKIIEIGKELVVLNGELTNSTDEELAKETFNFRDQAGNNCLIALFSLPSQYKNKNDKIPENEAMMHEIEDSCRFLIQYAKLNNVDLMTILNATTEHGKTLFFKASHFSESIAIDLFDYGVNVNSVDYLFQTPSFRVRNNFLSESYRKVHL